MADLIVGLYEDWLWLDERIETITREIEELSQREANCQRLMSIPGVGPVISTAVVAAIGTGEAFDRGRDFGAWLGLIPRQYSTGGRPILGRISKRGSRVPSNTFHPSGERHSDAPAELGAVQLWSLVAKAAPRLHRNKLATALANKLARIAWSVLRHGKAFDVHRLEPDAI